MDKIGIIGRIPGIRDRILLPVNRSDGGQSYLTAREALQFQNGIESANRRAPNIFFDFLSLVGSAVSSLISKP